jgi:methylmalonyl-CoA/ethylmalonyl-CoA epimerase
MNNPGHPLIKVSDLQQMGMVVRNIDKTMESLWNTFGIGPWNVFVCEEGQMSDTTYHGKPSRYSFKAAMTQHKEGAFELELIEPLSGDNIYSDFLKEHGEGTQHICGHREYSLEAYNKTEKAMEKAGFPCLMGGTMYTDSTSNRLYVGRYGYFDTTKVLGTILEILQVSPNQLNKNFVPAYVYPKVK